jgi:gamma-glutamyltranspeptidase/glutathione hydrolase
VEHPPNGQGATAILLNHILSEFDIAAMDPWGTLRAHIEAEATKLAYATRDRIIGDPDHVTGLQEMLDPATGKALAAQIDPTACDALPAASDRKPAQGNRLPDGGGPRPDGGVDHLLDLQGFRLGRGVGQVRHPVPQSRRGLPPGRGAPERGGWRQAPLHTIIPAMLKENGKVTMPFGVMGGQYQSTGHARMITNIVDFGLTPQAAIDAPRCFTEYGPMKVEKGYSPPCIRNLPIWATTWWCPQPASAARRRSASTEHGVLEGGSDPRKDGCALGY